MITHTQGIVLSYIKYRETSIIARIFTRKYGLRSFLINGILSQKAKKSIGHYQPFTLLDLQVYYRENKDLLRLSEAKIYHSTPSLSQNIRKSTIALFLTEILAKTLHHEHHENNRLYYFLQNAILELEMATDRIEDFHLAFLVRLSPFLGFALDGAVSLQTGNLSVAESAYLSSVIAYAGLSGQNPAINATGETRKKCLEAVIHYYREHIAGFGEIKSLKVLHEIFH